MLFEWTYFLSLQGIVLLVYILLYKTKEKFELSKLYASRFHFLVMHLAMFHACYWINSQVQLFCNPVPWAAIIVIAFCGGFLLFPFLRSVWKTFALLFAGLGFFHLTYIILFARYEYLIFLVVNAFVIGLMHVLIQFLNKGMKTNIWSAFYLYPSIILSPFLILYELYITNKTLNKQQKYWFYSAPVFLIIILIPISLRLNHITNEVEKSNGIEQNIIPLMNNPIDSYFVELTIGIHIKYHTELCLYDGWRPPMHNPLIVINNKVFYPFSRINNGLSLLDASELHQRLFPNQRESLKCSCAKYQNLSSLPWY